MDPTRSNTHRALCLVMALLVMPTTVSSYHATGPPEGLPENLCIAVKACKPKWSIEPWVNYACKVYRGVRGYNEDKSRCTPDGSGFCCCRK
ncbi:hypothetical protein ZWY2020_021499 [Hordeum vulgare]|nr:hypothetical protein ZWY2020_021499 [Hordeum vulgare]